MDRTAVILANRRAAHHMALRWDWLLERDDLFAAADEGLCLAARDWRPERGPLSGCVFSRVRRCVIADARRRDGRGARPALVSDDCLAELPAPQADPDRLADLRRGLERLPSHERRLLLASAAGYSGVELARALGVSRSRVSQLLRSARVRMGG